MTLLHVHEGAPHGELQAEASNQAKAAGANWQDLAEFQSGQQGEPWPFGGSGLGRPDIHQPKAWEANSDAGDANNPGNPAIVRSAD